MPNQIRLTLPKTNIEIKQYGLSILSYFICSVFLSNYSIFNLKSKDCHALIHG